MSSRQETATVTRWVGRYLSVASQEARWRLEFKKPGSAALRTSNCEFNTPGFRVILTTHSRQRGICFFNCNKELRRLREKSIVLFGYYHNPGNHPLASAYYFFAAGQVSKPG